MNLLPLWLPRFYKCETSVVLAVARYWSNWRSRTRKPYEPSKIRRVFVPLLSGHAGDSLAAIVFLKTLKERRPDIETTLALAPPAVPFFANCDLVDHLIIVNGRRSKHRIRPAAEAIKKKNIRFCLVVAIRSSLRVRYLSFLHQINAKHYIGWGKERYALFDLNVPEEVLHVAQRWKAAAQIAMGESAGSCKVRPEDYFLPTDKNEEDRVRKYLDQFSPPPPLRVLINLFASASHRCFQESEALKLLRLWHDRFPEHLLLLLPVPGHEAEVHRISAELNGANISVAPSLTSYATTTALARQVDLVFSPDTGMVHFCSALNTPIIAIYREDPRNFSAWKPISDRQAVIFTRPSSYPGEKVPVHEFDHAELMAQVENLSAQLRPAVAST